MTKQVITTKQGEFTVSAVLQEQSVRFPNGEGITRHNRYSVSVRTDAGRASFKFYDSQANLGLTELSDLRGAFACFVNDAILGRDTFDDFCAEFSYDTDSRRAEKIYRECVRSAAKLERIFTGDIYDLANELDD